MWVCVIISCLCTACTLAVNSKVRASVSKDYDLWENLTTEELTKRARICLQREMPDSALVCYSIISNRLPEAKTGKERMAIASAKMNVGYIYSTYFYDFHNAFDFFSEALKIAENEDDKEIISFCYINLGSLFSTYHQMVDDSSMLDKGIEMYRKAYLISKEVECQNTLLTAVYNLAIVYLEREDVGRIRKELDDFVRIDSWRKSERWKHVSYFIKGLLAIVDGNSEEAIINFRQSLRHENTSGIPQKNEIVVHLAMAINSRKNGSLEEAEKSCLEVLRQADENGFKDITSFTYRTLGRIYEQLGNDDKAHEYRLKYFDFKDSLISSSKIKDVKNLQFLEELNAKNEEVSRLSQQKSNQGRILTLSIVALILATGAFISVIIYNKRLRKRNLELYDRLQESLDNPPGSGGLSETNREIEQPGALGEEGSEDTACRKYKNSVLSSEQKDSILSQVTDYLAASDEIYSPDFSLDQLADILRINRSYLSQAINETGGINFKTLLNSYRIREACRRFEDSGRYSGMTIEAVGQSVGFLSRKNFGVAFRKETGLSPSAFVRIHKEKQNERENPS